MEALPGLSALEWLVSTSLPLVVVILAVVIAAGFDLRGFRLPNWLTLSLMASGVVWNCLTRGGQGLAIGVTGILVSGLPLLLLYSRGAMGAGDVKLMAGIGAWMGAWFGLHVIIVAGLVGGAVGLLQRLQTRHRMASDLKSLPIEELARRSDRRQYLLPFGLMILCGVLMNVVFPGIQQLTR
jgi:Flp pilus assembly protein protease CpaA